MNFEIAIAPLVRNPKRIHRKYLAQKIISRKRARKISRQHEIAWLKYHYRMAADNILVTHEASTDPVTGVPMRRAVMRNKLTEKPEEYSEFCHGRSGTLAAGMIIKIRLTNKSDET